MPVSYLSEKSELPNSDYFGTYHSLSKILPQLSYNILGRPMNIVVSCKKLTEAQEIRKLYHAKEELDITVLVTENLFAKLAMLYPNEVKVISKWGLLEQMIMERKMHFAKKCINVLYNAVDEKNRNGFAKALDILQENFPEFHEITKEDISKFFYVQDVVFPRQVLIAFLTVKRNRWALLKACESNYPSSLIYYAMRDNLDKLITSKGKFYETGQKDYLSGMISANNLAMMKTVFLCPIRDPYILLKLYEGGMVNDSC